MISEFLLQEKHSLIKEKIKYIKYCRLTGREKWFLELINGMEMFYFKDRRSSIYFKKNNMILFECKFNMGILRINNKFIKDYETFNEYKPYIIEMFYQNISLPKRNTSPNEYDKVLYVSLISDESIFGITL